MNVLDTLIQDFSLKSLKDLFYSKLPSFKVEQEDYSYLFDANILERYTDINLLGKADIGDLDQLLVITAKSLKELTSRSSKKMQYDVAKRILKEEMADAAFFIFYDQNGNFRFSFVKVEYLGNKKDFTTFKRYTYYVSPKLTNKTFKKQIGKADFADLNSILEAFSVEPVTKEFYAQLQNWYFWALENVQFPPDAEAQANGREISVIRLITRLMFVWFMRVRGLIPDELFKKESLNELLKDFSEDESTYYKVILQNLFFATLNTPKDKRRFTGDTRGHKGFNEDFGNHSVFRYHELMKDPQKVYDIFEKIPFLNGGLFECLDYKAKNKDERRYIDGFTRIKKYQPKVPNILFFAEEHKTDVIGKYLDKPKEKYPVQGLINLFDSYNFTIDENEPDDIEVALDPELLGSIFENLLAAYNPETATTARKATGSYYTPREIVNYMVEQSLIEYFKTHLQEFDIADLDKKIKELVTSRTSENPFDEYISMKISDLISGLRVVDPAVGSGAFPMAMLNKLVFLLAKLDPDNKLWKISQIQAIKKSVKDPDLRNKLIREVEDTFNRKNADYGRKLYLIDKCIYGIDIQQIAIEITKLRFFISLLVDEEIDFSKPENNYEIRTLPNLDFKFMQGNSLIATYYGIDFRRKKQDNTIFDFDAEYLSIISDFEEIKAEYQNESDPQLKKQLFLEIEKLIIKIFESKLDLYFPNLKRIEENAARIPDKKQRQEFLNTEKQKLFKKYGFDIEQAKRELIEYTEGLKVKNFFLWDVYFAEVFTQKQGFDIVIGNPPYVSTKGINKEFKEKLEDEFGFADDLYAHFIFKGMQVLADKGVLAFITSKTYWTIQTKKRIRELLLNSRIIELFDTANPFKAAMVDTAVFIAQKKNDFSNYRLIVKDGRRNLENPKVYTTSIDDFRSSPNNVFFIPTEKNKRIQRLYGEKVKYLLDQWWDKIKTSTNIEKNKLILNKYRDTLSSGDITLLGLITEGGQGLATANNGKYIGVLEGSKWAQKIAETRPDKLWKAIRNLKINELSFLKSKKDVKFFLEEKNEFEIRDLFDKLKEKYGRDIFGQGYLYKIVSQDEIVDVNSLTDDEKLNGIEADKTFVPYDKGDKDGNRWYLPTPYFIDWSRENVMFLKENSGKKGKGMPVVRNQRFYFREGFTWTDVNSTYLKARLKDNGVYDVLSMSLFTQIYLPDWFYVLLINSEFISKYVDNFINSTSHFQINDARQLPIIIPNEAQLKDAQGLFNKAYEIQVKRFSGELSSVEADAKLSEIQKEVDRFVEELYEIK